MKPYHCRTIKFGTENRILYRPFRYLTLNRSASLFQHPRKPSLQGEINVVTVHSMKAYGLVKVKRHSFLTSALNGGKPSPSCSGRSNTAEKSTVLDEHEVGRTAELEVLERREVSWLCRIPDHSSKTVPTRWHSCTVFYYFLQVALRVSDETPDAVNTV
jgi:hypothetical protein